MILYKYVPPERIDILRNGRIAFPPAWLFKDPFEVRPVYAGDASKAIALFEECRPIRAKAHGGAGEGSAGATGRHPERARSAEDHARAGREQCWSPVP
jgi:hypothetical protein